MITALGSLALLFPPKTDWFRILAELDRAGVNNLAVARALKRDHTTVLRWKQGNAEPRHSDGAALLALHARFCTRSADCAELQGKTA